MRDRLWRRYQEERIVKKRLKRLLWNRRWYRGLYTSNGLRIKKPTLVDYLNTKDYFNSKTITTTYHDSRDKAKYSPNRSSYWREGSNVKTREYRKREFLKILKENGLK